MTAALALIVLAATALLVATDRQRIRHEQAAADRIAELEAELNEVRDAAATWQIRWARANDARWDAKAAERAARAAEEAARTELARAIEQASSNARFVEDMTGLGRS